VFLLGKQDQVYEKLSLADLFLLPSDHESFGLAALEAMACEVPVIASNVGGLPEVIESGVDGYLVEPRDVGTFAHVAIEILSRPDRGRQLGQRARASARRKFCTEDIIPRYEAYYEKVLAGAAAARA
jgi:glycosyltransferase involved in cell wall biosynthesis